MSAGIHVNQRIVDDKRVSVITLAVPRSRQHRIRRKEPS
jgi:hypothetical protein